MGLICPVIRYTTCAQIIANVKSLRTPKIFHTYANATSSLRSNQTRSSFRFISNALFHNGKITSFRSYYCQLWMEAKAVLYETESMECQRFCDFGIFMFKKHFWVKMFVRNWWFYLWSICWLLDRVSQEWDSKDSPRSLHSSAWWNQKQQKLFWKSARHWDFWKKLQ